MSLHIPLPKIRTFRFSLHIYHLTLLKWSPLWRWNSQSVLTFRCQKISPSLFRLSQVARLFFPSKKWIKLIPKTIGNRKRDCAWGCARGINTIRENLQKQRKNVTLSVIIVWVRNGASKSVVMGNSHCLRFLPVNVSRQARVRQLEELRRLLFLFFRHARARSLLCVRLHKSEKQFLWTTHCRRLNFCEMSSSYS